MPHMERLMILSIKAVYDYGMMLTREKRLECYHDTSPHGHHTRVNTNVKLNIWYFLILLYLKPIHIMFFKCICIIKEILVVSDLVLPDVVREGFDN